MSRRLLWQAMLLAGAGVLGGCPPIEPESPGQLRFRPLGDGVAGVPLAPIVLDWVDDEGLPATPGRPVVVTLHISGPGGGATLSGGLHVRWTGGPSVQFDSVVVHEPVTALVLAARATGVPEATSNPITIHPSPAAEPGSRPVARRHPPSIHVSE